MLKSTYPPFPVLLVDDEEEILKSFTLALRTSGINNIMMCRDERKLEEFLKRLDASVVLLDLNLPHIPGQVLLKTISENYPHVSVIVITGNTEIETAVECMKSGAFDYMVKPVEKSRLVSGVKRAIELKEMRHQIQILRNTFVQKDVRHAEVFDNIVTRNSVMLSLFRYAECIAQSPEPVMITGETGVGKELMARAIHELSGRVGEFVAVNVAGVDDNVFSDTLFGHVKGAYTSAEGARKGMVERASGGTLLLDEIGDLAHNTQVKLLRLLQEGEYFPLGSDVAKRCEARVIVTTNKEVSKLQNPELFRKDLYYRLFTHHIHIPPLRDRLDDLPLLVDHFVAQAARELGKPRPTYSDELLTLLSNYHFPGNVRELRTMIYDAMGAHRTGQLSLRRFLLRMETSPDQRDSMKCSKFRPESSVLLFADKLPTIHQATLMLIKEALKRAKGNQSMAARMLGISRQRLARQLKYMKRADLQAN